MQKWRPLRQALPAAILELESLGMPRGPKFDAVVEEFFRAQLHGKAKTPEDRPKILRKLAGIKEPPKKKPEEPEKKKRGEKLSKQAGEKAAAKGAAPVAAAPAAKASAKPAGKPGHSVAHHAAAGAKGAKPASAGEEVGGAVEILVRSKTEEEKKKKLRSIASLRLSGRENGCAAGIAASGKFMARRLQ